MRNMKTMMLTALLLNAGWASADNAFSIEEFELKANETKEIEVLMTNDQETYGFGMTIELPEGVSVLLDEDGFADLVGTNRLRNGLIDGNYKAAENVLKVQFATGRKIYGNSGEAVFSFTVHASDQIATGTHTLLIKNQKVTVNNAIGDPVVINCDQTEVPYTVTTRVEAVVGSAGYATFSWPRALDFSACEGLTAFVATSASNGKLELQEVTKVPAATGLVLKGTGEWHPEVIDESEATDDSGLLNATSDGPVSVEGDGNYGLALREKVGFYLIEPGVTIPQYRAYLTGVDATALAFVFDETATTGINTVDNESLKGDVFTLDGRKVPAASRLQKGIYIVNGKKQVIK